MKGKKMDLLTAVRMHKRVPEIDSLDCNATIIFLVSSAMQEKLDNAANMWPLQRTIGYQYSHAMEQTVRWDEILRASVV